ncbi:MAG TPA: hypothetical protein VHQ65_13585 [Thermoanaerobaculia bacterium]|nr:hypothetical protein [Thermoanaerobaculia bacterium]
MREPLKPIELFRLVAEHEVEAILVGGVAAVIQGASYTTFDVDIVYRRTPENIARLATALRLADARYLDPAGHRLEPTAEKRTSPGHHLLVTRFGRLDVLAYIGEHLDYEQLLPDSRLVQVGDFQIMVLDLQRLVELKQRSTRDKDRAVLPNLLRALRLRGEEDDTT